jgi:hypothetical protein
MITQNETTMKKAVIYLATIALSLISLTGCDSLLNVKPQSSITEEVYYQNEGDFEPNLTGIYTFMRSFANNVTYGIERSEELVAASNSRFGVAWSQIIPLPRERSIITNGTVLLDTAIYYWLK